uniref:SH3 domain-binding protein 5 n=2 Tax=Eptatretus burgeri TaxID=7764 RepID=A0A8C4R5J9_EPTBU
MADKSKTTELEEEEEEDVDPRVKMELEKLNQATADINHLEIELEDARSKFRQVLGEVTQKLDEQLKKGGKAVEESKPYWEARRLAKQAQVSVQKSTQEFQRAAEVLRVAKETISLAEERLLNDNTRQFDSAWQEMLNHATQRVWEAEQQKTKSELEHRVTSERYSHAAARTRQHEKKLKRVIKKSRPYFDLKAKYYVHLEQLKLRVEQLQVAVASAKHRYGATLNSLEQISEEIHHRRKMLSLGQRGCGVGAEEKDDFTEELAAMRLHVGSFSDLSDIFEEESSVYGPSENESDEGTDVSSLSSCPSDSSNALDSSTPITRHSGCSSDLDSHRDLLRVSSLQRVAVQMLGTRSECVGAMCPKQPTSISSQQEVVLFSPKEESTGNGNGCSVGNLAERHPSEMKQPTEVFLKMCDESSRQEKDIMEPKLE